MICTPNSLVGAAACFLKIPEGEQEALQLYLLCQWANNLGPEACSHPVVDAWAAQVVINGDPAPTDEVKGALCRFMVGMDLAGLTGKMYAVNPFAPGGIITACTPLIRDVGQVQWTNTSDLPPVFQNADITVNGLQGNGSKYLMTGIFGTDMWPAAGDPGGGITIYRHSTGIIVDEAETGSNDLAGGADALVMAAIQLGGECYWDCWNNVAGAGRLNDVNPLPDAYHSFNRLDSTYSVVYQANSLNLHGPLMVSGTGGGTPPTSYPISVFALNDFDGTGGVVLIGDMELSFIAYHDYLTIDESSDFFDLVQQLRIELGGGWT